MPTRARTCSNGLEGAITATVSPGLARSSPPGTATSSGVPSVPSGPGRVTPSIELTGSVRVPLALGFGVALAST